MRGLYIRSVLGFWILIESMNALLYYIANPNFSYKIIIKKIG